MTPYFPDPKTLCTTVAAALMLAACGGSASPTAAPTQAPVATVAAPTKAPEATKAPAATQASAPTAAPTKVATTAATTAPTKAAEPTKAASSGIALPSLDPREAIIKAQNAQLAAKAYRATTEITSGDGKKTNLTIEFVAPDSYHMAMDRGTSKQEFVLVGGKSYVQAGGKWIVSPTDISSVVKDLRDSKLIEEIQKGISDAKFVGPDVVNGAPALVYTFTSIYENIKSDNKLWVRAADGLPVKSEVVSDISGTKSNTVQTYDYDPNIKIEAPAVSN